MSAVPHRVTVPARDERGRPVFLVAAPIYDTDGDDPSGAAVAVGDPDAGAAEHLRLAWALAAGTAVLALVSAALGHTLSGRSVRPAIASLTEQERLLADAAHELRTPVAALRAAAETAIAETEVAEAELAEHGAAGAQPAIDPATYRAHLDTVLRQTQRLSRVLDALLTRARLAAGSQPIGREPLRLDLLAEDTVADAYNDLGIASEHIVLDARPSVVEADPTLLRLALRNLLENAILHGRRPDAPTRLRVEVVGDSIAVSDNGPGVPEELLAAPFTRYSSRTGNGLGLAIAADVAAAHGGRLDVRNAPDGGAVFTLTLS
jgi:signal transduction histidine kinase